MYLRLCKLCKPKLQVKVTKDISSTFLCVFFHTFLILVNKRNVDGRAKLSAKNVLELYAHLSENKLLCGKCRQGCENSKAIFRLKCNFFSLSAILFLVKMSMFIIVY